MILLVDVGNTALKTALFDGKCIQICNFDSIEWQDINQVIYSHVATTEQLVRLLALAENKNIPCFKASVTANCAGVECGYENYQTLGIDRWLVVLACANELKYKNQDIIIIDSGTATTIDVVNHKKQHLGGWILPGLDLLVDTMASRAEKVFVDETTLFKTKLATDTPAALKNGCLVATIGAIQYALSLVKSKPVLVFAGGYGEFLQQEIKSQLEHKAIYSNDLIFKGLLIWYQNEVKSSI
ncbi:type III pantothenate kinase [Pseudoalteromonas denitrificans]|uniref:Type III pantothenate kinase n=1 Tax=Pseudoalteromonas denitrificans DSM 6059 TaxID=1123010 RepID=A0A1I1S6D0_9GAMM|nr:type III pantothenate kinase [Pseudoalteromonas denitrificans]SFD42046.1 type III pantothenate kinase [Pseudoalteromonas denitrificans DSM 6059]